MDQLIEEKRSELARLCAKYHVRRLALFGSAASQRFNPATSDLDFVVEYASVPPRQQANCYFGLLEDLERLFGTSVDLVEMAAITNPYFRESVEQTQLLVYEAA